MVSRGYAYVSATIRTENVRRFGLSGHNGLFRTNATGGQFNIFTRNQNKKKKPSREHLPVAVLKTSSDGTLNPISLCALTSTL